MGNDRIFFNLVQNTSISVLILPMRNGNVRKIISRIKSIVASSYPTYEEWKQVIFVPAEYTCPKSFLSYLYEEWETRSSGEV